MIKIFLFISVRKCYGFISVIYSYQMTRVASTEEIGRAPHAKIALVNQTVQIVSVTQQLILSWISIPWEISLYIAYIY